MTLGEPFNSFNANVLPIASSGGATENKTGGKGSGRRGRKERRVGEGEEKRRDREREEGR